MMMKLVLFILSLCRVFARLTDIQSTTSSSHDLPRDSDSEDDNVAETDKYYKDVHELEILPIIPSGFSLDTNKNLRVRQNLDVVNPIIYHNGPIMTSLSVNIIWYNYLTTKVWTATDKAIIRTFLSDLNGSPWWAINNAYTNAATGRVPTTYTLNINEVTIAGAKLTLLTTDISSLVSQATRVGGLLYPANPNAIYLVLTAGGVGQKDGTSSFCTSFCGWHTYGTINLVPNIKYSFVGNPTSCLGSCAGQSLKSPNGSPGVDGAISVIAHELAETVTDPLLNAWYDATGMENADKCAWTWGTTFLAPNGAKANVKINTRNYLLQQNWKPATSTCGLA